MTENQDPYKKLRQLLCEEEDFPLEYIHKVIGKNDPEFRKALDQFLEERPEIRVVGKKQSSSGAHLSVTLRLEAADPEEVIELHRRTSALPGILVVL